MSNSLTLFTRRSFGILSRMSDFRCYSESGSGKSGSIREAGGAFGQREAAKEDEYFYRQQKEQLAKLKDTITDEIKFHEEQIKRHMEAIERNKKKVEEMAKEK
ncbi:UNVERIFIED_CONTAM: hypothetical protein PYX00_010666 [Menopon gallinae]|uniref:ATP synthase F1 subunit epsilon n=1 Tax=Menopon gallinae TaxID=328185 RepID=A0AAW2HGB7_9NEOP